jgi:hypothetical protein
MLESWNVTLKISGLKVIEVTRETGVNKQRIYDAMLIKAFRAGIRMTDLERWLIPYEIKLMDRQLKRIPKKIAWAEQVRVMVANNMKPLANRLWDTDKSQDIKTLDWMSGIECHFMSDKILSERQTLKRKSNADRRKGGILLENWEAQKRSNQWNKSK